MAWLDRFFRKATQSPRPRRRSKVQSAAALRGEQLEARRLLTGFSMPSTATGLVVTNTSDYTSAQTPIPGSLRYEVALANTVSGGTIVFNLGAPSSWGHSHNSQPEIVLTGGPLVISTNMAINGLGTSANCTYAGSTFTPANGGVPATGVTITQSNPTNGTLFDITAGTVQIDGLTMLGGAGMTGNGGAVNDTSAATVMLQSDIFTSNTATVGGAAFASSGPLIVNNSYFNLNTASQGRRDCL